MLRLASQVAFISRFALRHRATSGTHLQSSLTVRLFSQKRDTYHEHHQAVIWRSQVVGTVDHGVSAAGKALDEGAQAFANNNHVGPLTKDHMVPRAKGFAAEHLHSTAYNIDAAQKGINARCRVLQSNARHSPDLVIEKPDAKPVHAQLKYGSPGYVKTSFKRPEYADQMKVTPSDQPTEGRMRVQDGTQKVEAFGAESSDFSNKDATECARKTGKEFKETVIKAKELKQGDLRDIRSTKNANFSIYRESEYVDGSGTFLDGSRASTNSNIGLSRTTSSSNMHESYSATVGIAKTWSKNITDTGTPLDGAIVHGGLSASLGGSAERVSESGGRGGDRAVFAGIGASAGISKDVGSYTSSDGKTQASAGVSTNVAANIGVDSSRGPTVSFYGGVHAHAQACRQLTDNVTVGIHGSAGVSNLGLETSVGGSATKTTGSMFSNTSTTTSGTAHFTNKVPTNMTMSTSTRESGLVCSSTTTSASTIGLTGLSKTTTTSSEGIFIDETTSTTKSLSLLGPDEKKVSSVTTSQHVNSAASAAFAQGLREVATRGLTEDGVKNVAVVGGKSLVGSVANKAAQTAMKCPTSAGIAVGTCMSLASNAADLCDPNKRGAAVKAVAKDTTRAACAGLAAKALAGRAPGAVGAAVQVASAAPEILEALANGDTSKAGQVAADTAVTAGSAWAGAEAGAAVGVLFGPVGGVIGGIAGGVLGSLAGCWFRS